MFKDRTDAGNQLARALEHYGNQNVLVLSIPRGGVEVGYYIARHIRAEFSIIITRKLPFPDNPESGFGAVAEDGSIYLDPRAAMWLSRAEIDRIVQEERKEIARRIDVLRKGNALPSIKDRGVILVDDGIAMGSTMRVSIQMCRNHEAARIVVAAPVAGEETVAEIGARVDEIVVLEQPAWFRAVAQVYENWYDVPDAEVLQILDRWGKEKHNS